jgi:hypothetical protein
MPVDWSKLDFSALGMVIQSTNSHIFIRWSGRLACLMLMDMAPRDVLRDVLEGRSQTTRLHRTAKFLLNLHRHKATETTGFSLKNFVCNIWLPSR